MCVRRKRVEWAFSGEGGFVAGMCDVTVGV